DQLRRAASLWSQRSADVLDRRPAAILAAAVLLLILFASESARLPIAVFTLAALIGIHSVPADSRAQRTVIVWLGALLLVPMLSRFVTSTLDLHAVGLNELLTQFGVGLALAALVQFTFR